MKKRAKVCRSFGFDALEARLVLSGGNAVGAARNEAIVRDMGNFYSKYASEVPPLVQQYNSDNSSSSTSDAQYQADVNNLFNTTTGLVNGLASQLLHDLGPSSAAQIRILISGLPATSDGVTFPVNGPNSGSLLSVFQGLDYSDLGNLPLVANLTTAEVYSLAYSGKQNFPAQPFANFNATYTSDLGPLVTNYNEATTPADITTAQDAIDNTTRTDVYGLASDLNTQLGPKYATAIDEIITGTPGPITGTTTTTTTTTNELPPGAPGYGSMLATLNALPYSYRNDTFLLSSVVQLYAYI